MSAGRPASTGLLAGALGGALWLAASCAAPGPGEAGSATLAAVELRCEERREPLGLDLARPRLSWKLAARNAGLRNLSQGAWRVLVASSPELLARERGDLWDSGRVEGSRSLQVAYGGPSLPAHTPCWWAVQVWDQDGRAAPFSPAARFVTAGPEDGAARWIGRSTAPAGAERRALWLRRDFELDGRPERALATVASVGYHELYVNGRRVGEAVLQPCPTDLGRRVRSVTYELSELLVTGRNVVALHLAEGWAAFASYGRAERPLVRAHLDAWSLAADGSHLHESLVTDATWRWCEGVRGAIGGWGFGDYGGEELVCDGTPEAQPAALEQEASSWPHVREVELELEVSAQQVEPDRRIETLEGTVEEAGPTRVRIDLGRVLTGQLELELEGSGPIEIAVSERADSDCTYAQRSRLVLASGRGTFEHRFNYVCGRWVTLTAEKPFRLLRARAHLVHADYARLTRFECSDPLLQEIHDTALWTLRCLSIGGYVVDCAHRERWGYGGDAHATMGTALTHLGMGAFYAKWLEDWRDAQAPDGELPYTAPTREGGGGPAWSGIVVQLPWQLYVQRGDVEVLRLMQPTMERWLAWLETHVEDGLLVPHGHPDWGFLGDWVPPGRGQGKGERVDDESTLFFNNAYWLLCLRRMQAIAEVLAQPERARAYAERAEPLRQRIEARFLDASGSRYASGSQTCQALALLAGVPEPRRRAEVLAELCRDIESRAGHLDTGIHGTWLLLEALHAAGRDDLIWRIAGQRDAPSWGDMLAQGATTFWEQWDGVHSRTHSSFLSIGEWFVRSLAGIEPDPAGPGYARIHLRPWFGSAEERTPRSARASYDSVRGPIESAYRREGGRLAWTVAIPPNSRATLHFPAWLFGAVAPAEREGLLREGGRELSRAAGLISVQGTQRELRVELGSGRYEFTLP